VALAPDRSCFWRLAAELAPETIAEIDLDAGRRRPGIELRVDEGVANSTLSRLTDSQLNGNNTSSIDAGQGMGTPQARASTANAITCRMVRISIAGTIWPSARAVGRARRDGARSRAAVGAVGRGEPRIDAAKETQEDSSPPTGVARAAGAGAGKREEPRWKTVDAGRRTSGGRYRACLALRWGDLDVPSQRGPPGSDRSATLSVVSCRGCPSP
jgi:hypothetical protein